MQPEINIGLASNIFVRQMHFKLAGDIELGHRHSFDHLTLLAKGKLLVTVNNKDTEFTAPAIIFIRSDLKHKLVALTDNTVAYCIHGLRDKDKSDDIISPEMVPDGSAIRYLIEQTRIID